MKRADWHIHTHFSDGYASPAETVAAAARLGLGRIAITDHDGIDGCLEFLSRHPDAPDFLMGEEVEPRRELLLQADQRRAKIKIDFVVRLGGRIGMVVRFGPGSLVSRERPTLAVSRLVADYQVPIAVVTNGEDAEILAGGSGKVVGRGLEAIPSRTELLLAMQAHSFERMARQRAVMESRVAYCYEVDGACPCDDTICRLS